MLERWRRLSPVQQGFAWSLLLMLVWFGYWFVVNPGTDSNGATYLDVDPAQADADIESFRPLIIWVGGGLLIFSFMGIWSFVHLMRDRGTRFRDLDPAEQARREQAGNLLHNLGHPTEPEIDGD